MKVIAGLGNPGAEYANTPHSIGFETVDALARSIGAEWKASTSFKGELATGMLNGTKVLLVKPLTYMNLSGDCVAPVVKYHNANAAADLIVVSDDVDLPPGKLRIRKGGSAGGHNGLRSIIERTGTQDFIRVRLGVGRDAHNRGNVAAHVLGKFVPEDRKILDEVVEKAVEAIGALQQDDLITSMNRYNGWAAPSSIPMSGKENDK